jgi:hypothetical protein
VCVRVRIRRREEEKTRRDKIREYGSCEMWIKKIQFRIGRLGCVLGLGLEEEKTRRDKIREEKWR